MIQDHFSKFLFGDIIHDKKSETTFKFISGIIRTLRKNPNNFLTDNGLEFVNKELNSYFKKRGIKYLHGRPYHP